MTKSDLAFLKRLAAVCRKAGIKSFSGHGVQFELGPEALMQPKTAAKTKKATTTLHTPDGDIETDAPTELELLFWSSTGQEAPLPGEEQ